MTADECTAHTGGFMNIAGRQDFPCEKQHDPETDPWHERTSAPLATRWRDLPGGGRQFDGARTLKP